MTKNNPETDIMNAILCRLNMYELQNKLKAFRMNNAGVFNREADCYMKRSQFAPEGLADIMVFCKEPIPRVLFLEVKTLSGVQLPSQKIFQANCEAHGILYAIVRSANEAYEVLRGIGVLGGELDRIVK